MHQYSTGSKGAPQGTFQNAASQGAFQNAAPQGAFQNAAPQGDFQNTVPEGNFQNTVPEGNFQNTVPEGNFQNADAFRDTVTEDDLPNFFNYNFDQISNLREPETDLLHQPLTTNRSVNRRVSQSSGEEDADRRELIQARNERNRRLDGSVRQLERDLSQVRERLERQERITRGMVEDLRTKSERFGVLFERLCRRGPIVVAPARSESEGEAQGEVHEEDA
ncbi:uncharacterized protein BDV14DRAFT_140187 [Aspergillus stella-maris]|uniref:uncharacterized protein n=1 Tax=Aspergillus stella-maris TaxID=1810926 RepID=UPI003CCD9550